MKDSWLTGKSVLVTGAAGTVGSALLRTILSMKPRVARALDNHEHGLFQLEQQFGETSDVRWLLGDIRDEDRLRRAMEGIDIVFHTAALKHVSIGEYNPFEVVQTNLLGLQNVIQASLECNVERVIFTSSDKAVNPTNAMGASKLMGERLILAAQGMRGSRRTRFASVRFGNIVGSNGSVTTIFKNQISQGGPLTLTDGRMTRFIMGLDQAVRLLLRAAEMAEGGELFVLKMPALRIADLADVMIDCFASSKISLPNCQIIEIGSRTGEKLYEELLMEAEVSQAYENDEFIIYFGESRNEGPPLYIKEMLRPTTAYHSHHVPHLTKAEIKEFLRGAGILDQPKAMEVNR